MTKDTSLKQQYATASDDAKLSYYTTGSGPGILMVHGAACYGLTHSELAVALSPWYTVHVMSRRGRGLSAPFPPSVTNLEPSNPTNNDAQPTNAIIAGGKSYPRYASPSFNTAVLEQEVADLETLVITTGAVYIIALSSGALVTLGALLNPVAAPTLHKQVRKVVLYEPPVLFSDHATQHMPDLRLLSRHERELMNGDEVGAMITAMRMVQLGPGWIPRILMRWLSGMMLEAEDNKAAKENAVAKKGNCTFRGLGATVKYDFAVSTGMIGPIARYHGLREQNVAQTDVKQAEATSSRMVEILLVGGDKSPMYLRDALDALADTIPGAKKVMLPGVGHNCLCNKEFRGNPEKAVPVVKEFLV